MGKYFEKMMIDMDLRGMSEATSEAYLRRVGIFINASLLGRGKLYSKVVKSPLKLLIKS